MIRKELPLDWTLRLPSDKLITLTDGITHVGVLYDGKEFGDPQTLLLELSENSVQVKSLPHYIHGVETTTEKEIIIHLNEFFSNIENTEE